LAHDNDTAVGERPSIGFPGQYDPYMHLTLGIVAWTAIGALGVLGVAAMTVWLAVTGRRRDDRRRAGERERDDRRRGEDRERDDRRRGEDRERDDRRRGEDRQRDDRLREEARQEAQRRELAERAAKEDYEARQVVVFTEEKAHDNFTHLVTVSAPHEYPIKQIQGCIVQASMGMGLIGFGQPGNPPEVDDRRIYYTFWASLNPGDAPIIRFVDWHGNRYYQYEHYTERFPQNTDWPEAIRALDRWMRTGPKPD
jgi:hypothetical protein